MNVMPMVTRAVPRLPPGLAAPGPAAAGSAAPDRSPAGQRTRRDFLELAATATAAGSARGHAVHILREWELGRLGEAAELVVSELVTNSYLATAAINWPVARPPVRLWLLAGPAPAGPGCVLIMVWDGSPRPPEPRGAGQADGQPPGQADGQPPGQADGQPPGQAADRTPNPAAGRAAGEDTAPDAESGRGLVIVDALSADWGFYYPAEHYSPGYYGGKVTWALIGTPSSVLLLLPVLESCV